MADTPALMVLDAILGRGESSRLQHALIQTGIASQAGTLNEQQEDGGCLAPFAILAAGVAVSLWKTRGEEIGRAHV